MRIRKEAIWPTECPVRTRYKGSPRPYDLAPFLLWIPCPSFSLIDPPRLVSLALVSPCFPTRSSSLNCESHVLESVGYVTRRKRKLDFPAGTWCAASSGWSSLSPVSPIPIRRRHDSRLGDRFFSMSVSILCERNAIVSSKEQQDSNK